MLVYADAVIPAISITTADDGKHSSYAPQATRPFGLHGDFQFRQIAELAMHFVVHTGFASFQDAILTGSIRMIQKTGYLELV